jgi:hypothetical protein
MRLFVYSGLFAGICTAAVAQDAPDFNISSQQWKCSQICRPGLAGMPTPIAQDGRNFIFTNEWGNTTAGVWEQGRTIRVTGWNIFAIVSPSGKEITFSNGSVWIR